MGQDYAEGDKYEKITSQILKVFFNIDAKMISYKEDPKFQDDGMDGIIVSPASLKNITLQVKMFKNTNKYQTFPWEVSRFLLKEKTHIIEPHKADFHIIVDPVESVEGTELYFWIIKTGNYPSFFMGLWERAVDQLGEPSGGVKWERIQGKVEEYYRMYFEGYTLYQLTKKHTALQRNVRFFLNKAEDMYNFSILIPKNTEISNNKGNLKIKNKNSEPLEEYLLR